jgi:hypothetical protein
MIIEASAPVSAAALASISAASLPEKPKYAGIQWIIIRTEGDMVVNFSDYMLAGCFELSAPPGWLPGCRRECSSAQMIPPIPWTFRKSTPLQGTFSTIACHCCTGCSPWLGREAPRELVRAIGWSPMFPSVHWECLCGWTWAHPSQLNI